MVDTIEATYSRSETGKGLVWDVRTYVGADYHTWALKKSYAHVIQAT